MVNGRSEWRGTRLLAPMARERLRLDRYACEGCEVSVADGDGGARRVLERGHVGTWGRADGAPHRLGGSNVASWDGCG